MHKLIRNLKLTLLLSPCLLLCMGASCVKDPQGNYQFRLDGTTIRNALNGTGNQWDGIGGISSNKLKNANIDNPDDTDIDEIDLSLDGKANDFAPGISECLEAGTSNAETSECTERIAESWKNKMDEAYAKAQANCRNASDSKACLANLERIKRSWLKRLEHRKNLILDAYRGGSGGGITLNKTAAEAYYKCYLELKRQ